MFERFKRLVFLPVLVSNLYSMYGVLFLQWSVADLFFWFWSEFVFMGVTTFVLTLYWVQTEKTLHRGVLKNSPFLFLFAFLAVLFYATMFAALAYKGEWKSWDLFPQFLADKEIGLIATFISFVVFLG